MKKLVFISMVMAAFGLSACAQKKGPSAEVTKTFSEKFSGATDVKWDKENAKEWEAEFKMSGKDYSANFNTDGTWVETEYKLEQSELPEAVMAALESEFADYKVESAEVSETADGKVFELTIENDETSLELAIDASGKVLKKEAKKEEKDEEKEDNEKQ